MVRGFTSNIICNVILCVLGPFHLRPQKYQETRTEKRRISVLFICLNFHTRSYFYSWFFHTKKSLSKTEGDIGEVFVSSVYNVLCILCPYVCHTRRRIEPACLSVFKWSEGLSFKARETANCQTRRPRRNQCCLFVSISIHCHYLYSWFLYADKSLSKKRGGEVFVSSYIMFRVCYVHMFVILDGV